LDAGNRTLTGDKRSIRGLVAGFAVALLALALPAASFAAFPPGDNGVIAHISTDGNSNPPIYGVWTIHPDGTNPVNLMPGRRAGAPAWFPNGDRLVFTAGPNAASSELFVMDASGGPATQITSGEPKQKSFPTVSPDGASIAFIGSPSSGVRQQLYIMRVGEEPHLVRPALLNHDYSDPDFSPDGRHVVFMRTGTEPRYGIFRFDLVSGVEQRLTNSAIDAQPAYSPDGSRILFVREDGIWTMNANGSNEQLLFNLPDGMRGIHSPSFSPDGKFISFSSGVDTGMDLFVVDADGLNLRNVVPESTVNDIWPAWQRLPEGSGDVLGEVSGGKCAGAQATITGSDRVDRIRGTRGADVIVTGRGSDIVFGRGGRDIICGDGGRDDLLGGGGRDLLVGGRGKDNLWGGPRRDSLFGGPGVDRLIGGGGRDFYGPGRDLIFP
jgi:Tol biopolymer transport system component